MPEIVNPLLTFQAFYIRQKLGSGSNCDALFLCLKGTPLAASSIMLHSKRLMFNVLGRACSQQEMREAVGARFYQDLLDGKAQASENKEQMMYLFNHHELTHKIYYKRYINVFELSSS